MWAPHNEGAGKALKCVMFTGETWPWAHSIPFRRRRRGSGSSKGGHGGRRVCATDGVLCVSGGAQLRGSVVDLVHEVAGAYKHPRHAALSSAHGHTTHAPRQTDAHGGAWRLGCVPKSTENLQDLVLRRGSAPVDSPNVSVPEPAMPPVYPSAPPDAT